MSQFPRYESYKDSGVQWLGEIPSHWQAKRLRFCIDTNPLKSEVVLPPDTVVSFVPMENVDVNGVMTLEHERILEDVYKGYTYFKELDVVIAKITPCFENGKSAIAENLVSGVGFGTTEFHVLRSKDNYSVKFLYYLVRSSVFMKLGESEMYGAGGQKRVPELFIKNFISVVPPVLEQRKISRFLDKQLAKIDALISKQETLLKKLEEQRIALISHAVTKGLDPNVEMKDSGVEWLGEVPKHWGIFNIKKAFDIYNGATPKTSEPNYWNGDIIWLTPADFGRTKEFDISDSKRKITEEGLNSCGTTLVPEGTVILSTRAPIGSLAIAREALCTNQGCKSLVPKGNVLSLYLAFYLLAHDKVLQILGQGTTFLELSAGSLSSVSLPKIPLDEQVKIVGFIEEELSSIDKVSLTVLNTINKLKEYRSTLITQAVTGKIDVRNIDVN